MKLNEVFSGNFLKADDLQGRTVRVTISKVEVKEFDDGNKIVIHFQGKDKCLVVNKTNANIIAENTGSTETDDWVGRTVQLCTKKVEFQGKLVPAIRVVLEEQPVAASVPKTPAPAPAAARADTEDDSAEVPF